MDLLRRRERDTYGQDQPREQQGQPIARNSPPRQAEIGWKRRLHSLREFWAKVNSDGVFNLSAMLAYNLLMSMFPILLALLAVAGFALQFFGGTRTALEGAIMRLLPRGGDIVPQVVNNLEKSSGVFLVIGLATAAFAGSRLFISIGSCFSVIFRLRPRDALRQNLMAFGMLLLYIVLAPVIVLSSSVANVIATTLFRGTGGLGAVLVQAAGVGAALVAAVILFAAIYIVVPNPPAPIKEIWRGTLTGGVLLILYELVFPLYQRYLLKPDNYGATAGFAIVILVFFYYFAFILLLGAEVNSWAAGQREIAKQAEHTTGYDINRPAHRPQYTRPLSAEALDPPRREQRRPSLTSLTPAPVFGALATAAIAALMWLLGRDRRST